MGKLVDLQEIKQKNKQTNEVKYVDAQASYVVLKNCLDYLKMNNLEELNLVKREIRLAMKKLSEISINGK